MDEAGAACRRALALAPGFAHALDNLGNVVRVRGRLDEAMACYQQALLGIRHWASSHHFIGHVLQYCGRFDEAARFYEAARALEPKDPRFHGDLGSLAAVRGDYDKSARHYLSAVTLDPNFVEGHQGRGQALLELGLLDEAESCFGETLRLDPKLATSWVGLARLQSERGDLDLACQSARAALAHQPNQADAHWRLAITLKGRLPDVEVQAMEGQSAGRTYPTAIAPCCISAWPASSMRGNYKQAAAHLETANAIQAAMKTAWGLRRDIDEHSQLITQLIASFTPDLSLAAMAGPITIRDRSSWSVYRSGYDLGRAIASSHPNVHSAGELREVFQVFESLPSRVGQPQINPFQALELLSPESAKAAAQQYLDSLNSVAPTTATHVIDKMPDNFQLLGLIAILWPVSTSSSATEICEISQFLVGLRASRRTHGRIAGNSWPAGSPIINGFWSTGGTPSRSNVWKSVTRVSLETCRDMRGAWWTSWSSTGTPPVWISSQPGVSCVLPAWSRFASRSTPVRLDGGRTTSRTLNRCSRSSSDTESSWLRIERSRQIQAVGSPFLHCAIGQRWVVLDHESKCLHAAVSITRTACALW